VFHLESSQTGSSLFTHEADADSTRQRLTHILQSLYGNSVVNREELMIFKGEFVWHLNVDVLVLDELGLFQLDMIAACVRGAFQNLSLPQVIATLNANTNKIEVGLVEEVYTDRQNTD
jgi:exosome complex RNA-binding protein Rrp42 (RNase PH superfamily)